MTTYLNYDVFKAQQQMFVTPVLQAPEIVWLVFYVIAFFVALHRFRWAPALLPLVLHTAVQVSAFSARLYWKTNDDISLSLVRAVQALLAIGFLLLCYQMIILKAEHFHIPRSHPSSWFLHRYRVATHLLSILLFVNFIIIIVYSALLGREDVKGIYHAFNIILFVFWGLLFLFMLFTPFWARATHAPTGVFLTFLTLFLLIPIVYLELRFQRDTSSWVRNSMAAFHVLWVLPEALVTIGMLLVPIGWWYPELQSAWIY